jgi:hypothetical protein
MSKRFEPRLARRTALSLVFITTELIWLIIKFLFVSNMVKFISGECLCT